MLLDRRHLLLGTTGVLAAGPALAHHGWSGYDADTVLTLTGPVQEVYFGMPHCLVTVEADGKTWECVLAPLSRMTARGLPEGSIEVGETVTVVGYPHRGEASEMRAERITVKGQTVELR
jgi:Family of unknown function (DUF6152)